MTSNLDRYKKDLESLIERGELLHLAMESECMPAAFEKAAKEAYGKDWKAQLGKLPKVGEAYQGWYSEAHAVIRQLLPDRLNDFIAHYEKPKQRKELSFENYRIADSLQGLTATLAGTRIVGPEAAISHLRQQVAILKAARARFESSLFDIRQLVQADFLDSALDEAALLLKHRFVRAAGAVAGVVLEKHLGEVCTQRSIPVKKKNSGIGDLNELLKAAGAIDIPQWRFIQHLADIRNLCDHDKKREPTPEQVQDLLSGAAKVLKSVF